VDRVVVVELVIAGVVDADERTLAVDERTTRVAAPDAGSCSMTPSIDAQGVSPLVIAFETIPLVSVNVGSPSGKPAAYTSSAVLTSPFRQSMKG
jgi:hypothetical protein